MILETERTILRPWEETDAEECFRYAKDPLIGPICGWPAHTSVEESLRIIKEDFSKPVTLAIIWKETGLPIGSIRLHNDSDLASGDDESELGYWLGVPYWGQGIVQEVAKEVLRYAFEDQGLSAVWCGHFEGNVKSKRVQEKLGFQYQWTTEDVPVPKMNETRRGYVSRMTKEEWTLQQKGEAP